MLKIKNIYIYCFWWRHAKICHVAGLGTSHRVYYTRIIFQNNF